MTNLVPGNLGFLGPFDEATVRVATFVGRLRGLAVGDACPPIEAISWIRSFGKLAKLAGLVSAIVKWYCKLFCKANVCRIIISLIGDSQHLGRSL